MFVIYTNRNARLVENYYVCINTSRSIRTYILDIPDTGQKNDNPEFRFNDTVPVYSVYTALPGVHTRRRI